MEPVPNLPRRTTRAKAIVYVVVLAAIVLVLFLAIDSFRTTPEKFPGGENPATKAPSGTEQPESAKPPAQRDSG